MWRIQENPYEVVMCPHRRTVYRRVKVRTLDRISAVLLSNVFAFTGLAFLLDLKEFAFLFWPWGLTCIPLAVMALVSSLSRRVNRLWQIWLISGFLTLIAVALVGGIQLLWLISFMSDC